MGEIIKVKAMVDKEKNRVVFAESDEDFGDVLFSFLTIPMGTIASLTQKENLPSMPIGCINNLYASVQNLDVKYFRTEQCQKMLLHPRNGAPTQCRRLKLSIGDMDDHGYFSCKRGRCWKFSTMFYQPYCACGFPRVQFQRKSSSDEGADPLKVGAFLKGLTRLVISDDLQLMQPTSSASFSFLSDLGVMEALEVREFDIGHDEVINLLKSSLVSKEALTQTLLKKNENLFKGSSCSSLNRNFQLGEAENGEIGVKLFVSKSKKIVCFAEVGEDFVDLVFSFLPIPLGYVLKQMQDVTSIDASIVNLYKSIVDLDVDYFKSSKEKEVLLNPKIPPKYGYDNQHQLIGVEEVSCNEYFDSLFTSLTVEDPKIPSHKEDKSNGGFMAGPAMFTVTDNLNVIPISSVSGVNILNKLHVPLNDVQERVVHVRNKEAVSLLIASFVFESALTDTFLKKYINP